MRKSSAKVCSFCLTCKEQCQRRETKHKGAYDIPGKGVGVHGLIHNKKKKLEKKWAVRGHVSEEKE